MKTAIALILFAALTAHAHAVEYVTLNVSENIEDFGPPTMEKNLPPTSLVEIVGHNVAGMVRLLFFKQDGTQFDIGATNIASVYIPFQLGAVTGLSKVELQALSVVGATSHGHVTLKITSAAEINAVTPSAVLVLPEGSTGNHDVIIETSSDLVTWQPFFSQTVNSADPTRFFRTRVTKTPAP